MITHVAIRWREKVYSLPKPNRHHDVIRLIAEENNVSYVDAREDDQGFLDENGQFYRRRAALMHALMHNQVKDPKQVRLGMLFSEDVW